MIKILEHNPYRILGVYADATASEIKRNETKIRRYLEVGKDVTFPTDELGNLGTASRTTESLDWAISQLNMPQDKLKYALFWFTKEDSVGLNLSVSKLLSDDTEGAIGEALSFLHQQYRSAKFEETIIGNTILDETEIIHLYLNELVNAMSPAIVLSAIKQVLFPTEHEYVKSKVIEKPIETINNEISIAKAADRDNPEVSRLAGNKLIKNTRSALLELNKFLGHEDLQYQVIADALAKQILQCGINYFNATNDDDSIEQALKIQEYALQIASGKVTKDRCQQNVDILLKQKKEAAPLNVREEDKAIHTQLADFCKKPDRIVYSVELLNGCQPYLLKIKTALGVNNEYYLKVSTKVVGNALHNLIEEVNEAQKPNKISLPSGETFDLDLLSEDARRAKLEKIKTALRAAWKAIIVMDTFDMESDFRTNRYNPNRNTLKSLCNQMGISTYVPTFGTSSTSSSKPKENPTKKEEQEVGWGAYVFAILLIEIVWGICFESAGEGFWPGIGYSIIGWFMYVNVLILFAIVWIIQKIKNLFN